MTILGYLIELLHEDDSQGSEAIDIAKGKFAIPENWRQFKKAIQWQLHKQ